jgi:hypothetical protein
MVPLLAMVTKITLVTYLGNASAAQPKGNPPWWRHNPPKQAPDTAPTQGSLTQDNFYASGAIRKGQKCVFS